VTVRADVGRIATAVLFPGLVLLVGCGSGSLHLTSAASTPSAAAEPGVSTYLCQGSSDDSLLQWRASGSDLSGTYEFVPPPSAFRPGLVA
jgi:hypothetical protein